MHTLWLWRKSTLISPLKCWLKPSNSFLLGISPKMPFLLVSFTLETWTERNGCFPLPISGLEAKHFYGDITQLTTRYLFVYSALKKELRHGAARECEDETFLQIFIYFQLLRMLSMRGTLSAGDKGIVVSSRFRLFFYSFLTRLLSERVYIQRIPLGEFESFSVFIVESVNIVNLQYFLWPHPSPSDGVWAENVFSCTIKRFPPEPVFAPIIIPSELMVCDGVRDRFMQEQFIKRA